VHSDQVRPWSERSSPSFQCCHLFALLRKHPEIVLHVDDGYVRPEIKCYSNQTRTERICSTFKFCFVCNFRVTERALTSIRFLIRKHYCPEPRFRVEAPINVSSRCMRRQVSPRCGGVGGAACDRQFVYSR